MPKARTTRSDPRLQPLAPEAVSRLLERATELHSAGRLEDAAAIYRGVEDRNPDAVAAAYFNGLIDVECGRLEDAALRFERVTRREPDSFDARYALAYVLQELGLWGRAADAYRRTLELKPASTAVRFDLARALEVLGRMDEALALYRALAEEPAVRAYALSRIAGVAPETVTDEELQEMRSTASDDSVQLGVRIGLGFSIGELLERHGRYDDAFQAFDRANGLRRSHLAESIGAPAASTIIAPSAKVRTEPPDKAAENHQAWIDFAVRGFTREFFERHAGSGSQSDAPIFIIGMPRSGSTLIEQILSSHPKVQGLGECNALFETIRGQYPIGPASEGPEHFKDLAKTYLRRLHALGWRTTPRVVDKMLSNYVYVGMIHLMFPRAVILHSVRDPVDTCLACWRQLFRTGHETTYDLKDVGEHYVRYRRMMDHWEQVLPGRVTPIRHEALVADPEGGIRELVRACGLKWDAACLSFHTTRRAVRTASVMQVRQPIFRTSVERWRRYERHLGPLFDALGPYAPSRS